MKIVHSFTEIIPWQKPVSLLCGSFDGIHLGHQSLIQEARKERPLDTLVLLTFQNHPLSLLAPEKAPDLLLPLNKKIEFLEKLEIDLLLLLNFNREMASLTAQEFLGIIKETFPLLKSF